MTQDEIIKMAEKAKLDKELADDYCRVEYWTATEDELVAFANLVAAKEREACIEACRKTITSQRSAWGANFCIEAIRARGQA
jgi:hypothetical protein